MLQYASFVNHRRDESRNFGETAAAAKNPFIIQQIIEYEEIALQRLGSINIDLQGLARRGTFFENHIIIRRIGKKVMALIKR